MTWFEGPRCSLRDDDRVHLRHMIDAADALAQFIDERTVDGLDHDTRAL